MIYQTPHITLNTQSDNSDSNIYTNMTEEELIVVLNGIHRTIPHSGYSRCVVGKSVEQLITTANWTTLSFDTETKDVGGMHSISVNNSRITTIKAGDYIFIYQVEFDSQDKSSFSARIIKNGSDIVTGSCLTIVGSKDSSITCDNCTTPLTICAANDYYELQVQKTSSLDILVYSMNTKYCAIRLY